MDTSSQTSPRPTRTAGPLGRYFYGVIAAAEDREIGPVGIDGGLVYTIGDGRIAAVVSDVPRERLRPERRRLAAHHEVLKRLLLTETVLPMAFGLIADSRDAVRGILAAHRGALLDQLRRVAGKVEMGLHVYWDVPNIFEYFVNAHRDLGLLRDQLFRGGRGPTQDEKIELGRLFDRTLAAERQARTDQVTAALRRHCAEIKENAPRQEREVMNLACLIGRDRQKEFEQGVFEAARFFDHHYAFDFNGPWPPHNFVEVALQV